MDCFECAKASDAVTAVGACHVCGVGLCLDHLAEAAGYRVGGTAIGCGHELPLMKPLHGAPEGIAAGTRHHSAGNARWR